MKTKLNYLWIAFLLIGIMILPNVLGAVGFSEKTVAYNSTNITTNYAYINYGEASVWRSLGFYSFKYWIEENDFVPYGTPYQAYIQYGLQPISEWNAENPSSPIDYCTILVKEYHYTRRFAGDTLNLTDAPVSTYTLNRTFTDADTSVTKDEYKFFISLNKFDFADIYFNCHFIDDISILTPVSLKIVSPTKNCLACQYYNSYKASFDEIINDAIQDYTDAILTNSKNLLGWNIELWITLFWISLIAILFLVIGIIFLMIYWVYLYIKNLGKKTV
jgi:hypothetical protein